MEEFKPKRSAGDQVVAEAGSRIKSEEPLSVEVKSDQPAEMELDLRGSICPGPTADTLAALKTLPARGKLAVISDYLPARQTIPRRAEGVFLADKRRRRHDLPDGDSERR